MRSAEEMSRMAPFIDGGRTVDRTNWSNTIISYYPFGGAIALALDLTLRDRSDGRVSLDDFMRAMWRKYGKPGGSREGYVDRPYTIEDAEATLAEVSGDRGVRARVLRALHPGPRRRRLRAAAVARRVHGAQAQRRTRVARRSPSRVAGRPRCGAGGADVADLRVGPRSGRRAAADRWAAHQQRRATSRPPSRGASRATPFRSCSSIAPERRGPGE